MIKVKVLILHLIKFLIFFNPFFITRFCLPSFPFFSFLLTSVLSFSRHLFSSTHLKLIFYPSYHFSSSPLFLMSPASHLLSPLSFLLSLSWHYSSTSLFFFHLITLLALSRLFLTSSLQLQHQPQSYTVKSSSLLSPTHSSQFSHHYYLSYLSYNFSPSYFLSLSSSVFHSSLIKSHFHLLTYLITYLLAYNIPFITPSVYNPHPYHFYSSYYPTPIPGPNP